MRDFSAVIIENSQVKPGIFNLWLEVGNSFTAIPGQFVNIYADRPDMLLPRPVSICDTMDNAIRLMYQVAGKGTGYLSGFKPGEKIRIAGPLGNGFNTDAAGGSTGSAPGAAAGKILIVGGGIGVPPLLFLAKKLKHAQVVLGFRSASSEILSAEFTSLQCDTAIATDDGSLGFEGNVMQAVQALVNRKDILRIYACGPRSMLKGASEYAVENGISCQISMEEYLGCGIGACLCCPVPVYENGVKTYKKLCKDGPVFSAGTVIWGGAL